MPLTAYDKLRITTTPYFKLFNLVVFYSEFSLLLNYPYDVIKQQNSLDIVTFLLFLIIFRSAKSNHLKYCNCKSCDLLYKNSHLKKNSTVEMNVLSFTQVTRICNKLEENYLNFHQKLQYPRWRRKTQRLAVQSQIA